MAKLIEEEGREFLDPNSLEAQVREYVKAKAASKTLESRTKELHEKLMEAISLQGYEDNEGNWQLELDFDADGIVRLEKQIRVSRKLDETLAESLLTEKGLWESVTIVKRVVDEDALMAAHYEGKISEEEIDSLFPAKTTWALWTKKA